MKLWRLLPVLVVFLGISLMVTSVYAEQKFAYVDLGQLFDEYSKTKEYDKILEKKQKDYEKEREKRLSEVKQLQEKISLLSDKEKEAKRDDLEKLIVKVQEFDRDTTQDLRKQRDEKVKEIFGDIETAIKNYAKKEGLTLVFDKRALVYENKGMDITKDIFKIINR